MKNKVVFDKVEKDIKKVPHYILTKLRRWAEQVEQLGLREVSKAKGWHDEPLRGKRRGQRSIRLSISYRAIYTKKPERRC